MKTDQARRRINLDPETVAVLRRHRAEQVEERLAVGPSYEDHDLVFGHVDGTPHDPTSVSRAFSHYSRRAGLPQVRLHDLRHGHASHLLAAGANAPVLSERLGHASAAFTPSVNAHSLSGQQEDAARAVAALVDGVM